MSRKNGKGQIHSNVLMPSSIDETELSKAVERGFLSVCEKYVQVKSEQLPIPRSLDKDLLRWRRMSARYKRGDCRHTEAEFRSLKVIAQWTVDINMKLRNQPLKKVEWKP